MAKQFEVGDVLPATTQLRISWDSISNPQSYENTIETLNGLFRLITIEVTSESEGVTRFHLLINNVDICYAVDGGGQYFNSPYDNQNYIDIDISTWPLEKRTVSYLYLTDIFYWEDLNPAPTGYSITYEENGGSTVTDLTEQTALPNPLPTTTKDNHVFAGWYYDNLFTQKANAGDELTANVTLYAKWYTPTTWCKDIADAIREKEGSSGNIKHVDFADRIRGLDTCIYLTQEEYDDITTPNENITYIIVEVE